MREFISDKIGDEYKEWETGNIVFLTAPTGSGKTTFVLEKLVKYVEAKKRSKILYLVNRKILKEQIEKTINRKISCKVKNVNEIIKVKTYQELEQSTFDDDEEWQYGEYEKSEDEEYEEPEEPGYDSQNVAIRKYDVIIADECHYFFSDSTYNPYTYESYDWIMEKRGSALLIFMSATIDQIKKYILKNLGYDSGYKEPDPEPLEDSEEAWLQKIRERNTRESLFEDRIPYGKFCVKEYGAKADYSHVDIHILEDDESIIEIITGKKKGEGDREKTKKEEEKNEKRNKEKWMVFVDSIKKGIYIHRKLKKAGIDSVFIESKWADEYDEFILDTVAKMTKEQRFDQQVVVATSVIDNGVSIKDIGLRNLVVMADTKEQFIQMLGRKRVDYDINEEPEKINLYLLKSSKRIFDQRKSRVEDNIECIEKYHDENDCAFEMLGKILKHPNWAKCCRQICHIEKGVHDETLMILNKFSREQYTYLQENYEEIIKRFNMEDEYAFIRQQAEWMGVNNIEEVIKGRITSLIYEVSSIIDEYKGKKLNEEMNVELREKIRKKLKVLLEECQTSDPSDPDNQELDKLIEEIGKSGMGGKNSKKRPLSPENFNLAMDILGMKYKMEKKMEKKEGEKKEGEWLISKVENTDP